MWTTFLARFLWSPSYSFTVPNVAALSQRIIIFSKNDRDNIDDHELASFRVLAKAYASLSENQIGKLLRDNALTVTLHLTRESL